MNQSIRYNFKIAGNMCPLVCCPESALFLAEYEQYLNEKIQSIKSLYSTVQLQDHELYILLLLEIAEGDTYATQHYLSDIKNELLAIERDIIVNVMPEQV
jgi:hypothetical protein